MSHLNALMISSAGISDNLGEASLTWPGMAGCQRYNRTISVTAAIVCLLVATAQGQPRPPQPGGGGPRGPGGTDLSCKDSCFRLGTAFYILPILYSFKRGIWSELHYTVAEGIAAQSS